MVAGDDPVAIDDVFELERVDRGVDIKAPLERIARPLARDEFVYCSCVFANESNSTM